MVTPDVAASRRVNDLIRVDANQFVTLSQVQDNRVQTSSGYSSSNRTDWIEDPNSKASEITSALSQQARVNHHRPPSSAADIISHAESMRSSQYDPRTQSPSEVSN